MSKAFEYNGKKFIVEKSNRRGKQLVATFEDGKKIHFGDPDMPEYKGTNRGDRYCARTISLNNNSSIRNANSLSRKILWNCKGKKSMKTLEDAGVNTLTKEEYFDSL